MTAPFAFTPQTRARADEIIARYPEGRQASAVLALLDLAQRQAGGWLPLDAIEHVAGYLAMPRMRVYEVATFYTMFNLAPVGRHLVQVCRTTPCWLRGAADLSAVCREVIGAAPGQVSADGAFTWMEVECLAACCNAPMVQIDDDYYEDLTPESFRAVLEALRRGETPEPGSQAGRKGSAPRGGLTTLKDGPPEGARRDEAPPHLRAPGGEGG